MTVVADDEPAADRAADLLDAAGAYDVNERAATWAEATAPVGGNRQVPALSTLPESSMTADVPVAPTDAPGCHGKHGCGGGGVGLSDGVCRATGAPPRSLDLPARTGRTVDG